MSCIKFLCEFLCIWYEVAYPLIRRRQTLVIVAHRQYLLLATKPRSETEEGRVPQTPKRNDAHITWRGVRISHWESGHLSLALGAGNGGGRI